MRRWIRWLGWLPFVVGCAAHSEPPRGHVHEILSDRPSGFWTSNAPAPAGAEYKYALMKIGLVVLAITGALVYWLVKRARAERAARLGVDERS